MSTDLQSLHAGRSANIKSRAQWLMLLGSGVLDLDAFFDAVSGEEGKALKSITLRQLMVRGLGFSRTKTEKLLGRMDNLLGYVTERRKMTIGWLLDPNCGGKRFQVWTEINAPKTTGPWPGFPFSRKPRNT